MGLALSFARSIYSSIPSMPTTRHKRQKLEDDAQMNIDLAAALENEDEVNCANVTLPTTKTLHDLPMELLEHILLEAIVSEVIDRKLFRFAWKNSGDGIAERLRTVCPLWNDVLTTDGCRNRLHQIIDSFPLEEFCFKVLAKGRFTDCVTVAALNDEVYVLCEDRRLQSARIDVYDHNNLQTAKRTIELSDVLNPWNLVACSVINRLYFLCQMESSVEIWRISVDETECLISTWIECLPETLSRLSTSVDGSLILFQDPPSTVRVYDTDGSLQHEIELASHISSVQSVAAKSNGNLVLVGQSGLTEVDREGNTLYEYLHPSGKRIYCALDLFDRIVTIDEVGSVRLLDCEFNQSADVKFELGLGCKVCSKLWYEVHYNRNRNEFVAFECPAYACVGASQTCCQSVTVFNFTERSVPNDAEIEQD